MEAALSIYCSIFEEVFTGHVTGVHSVGASTWCNLVRSEHYTVQQKTNCFQPLV